MDSWDMTVGSLYKFHDIEQGSCRLYHFVLALGSDHSRSFVDLADVSCTFDAKKEQFNLSCSPSNRDAAGDAFLRYLSDYSGRELKTSTFFSDVTDEAPKLSLAVQTWSSVDFDTMHEEVDRLLEGLFDSTPLPTVPSLIDIEPVTLRRDIHPAKVGIYTKTVIRDLERATTTSLELNDGTLIVKANDEDGLNKLVEKLDVCEKTFVKKQIQLSFDVHADNHLKATLLRFQFPTVALDADMAADPRMYRDYLELSLVTWDPLSRSTTLVQTKRTPIRMGTTSDNWPTSFTFAYGVAPDKLLSDVQSLSNESGKDRMITRGQHQGRTSTSPSTTSIPEVGLETELFGNKGTMQKEATNKRPAILIPDAVLPPNGHQDTMSSSAYPDLLCDGLYSVDSAFISSTRVLTPSVASPSSCGTLDCTEDAMAEGWETPSIADGDLLRDRSETLTAVKKPPIFDLHTEAATSMRAILQVAKTSYASTLTLEAVVGKLVMVASSVPEASRPRSIRPAQAFKPGVWRKFFNTCKGSTRPVQTRFTPRLTDSYEDAAYITDLLQGIGLYPPNQTTEFIVACHDTLGDQHLSVTVQDGSSLQTHIPCQQVGDVRLHFPSRTWDATLSVTTRKSAAITDLPAFSSVVDNLWARGLEDSDDPSIPLIGSELDSTTKVTSIHLRSSVIFTKADESSQSLTIHATKVQRLRVRTHRGSFHGYLEEEDKMRRRGHTWWELSIRSDAIDKIFSLNQRLEIGDIANYENLEVFQEECKRMIDLITQILPKLDGVGLNSLFRRARVSPEAKTDQEQSTKGGDAQSIADAAKEEESMAYKRFLGEPQLKQEYPDLL